MSSDALFFGLEAQKLERQYEKRLWDYFAGCALTGLLAMAADQIGNIHHAPQDAAGFADAMLAEREKRKESADGQR